MIELETDRGILDYILSILIQNEDAKGYHKIMSTLLRYATEGQIIERTCHLLVPPQLLFSLTNHQNFRVPS